MKVLARVCVVLVKRQSRECADRARGFLPITTKSGYVPLSKGHLRAVVCVAPDSSRDWWGRDASHPQGPPPDEFHPCEKAVDACRLDTRPGCARAVRLSGSVGATAARLGCTLSWQWVWRCPPIQRTRVVTATLGPDSLSLRGPGDQRRRLGSCDRNERLLCCICGCRTSAAGDTCTVVCPQVEAQTRSDQRATATEAKRRR